MTGPHGGDCLVGVMRLAAWMPGIRRGGGRRHPSCAPRPVKGREFSHRKAWQAWGLGRPWTWKVRLHLVTVSLWRWRAVWEMVPPLGTPACSVDSPPLTGGVCRESTYSMIYWLVILGQQATIRTIPVTQCFLHSFNQSFIQHLLVTYCVLNAVSGTYRFSAPDKFVLRGWGRGGMGTGQL